MCEIFVACMGLGDSSVKLPQPHWKLQPRLGRSPNDLCRNTVEEEDTWEQEMNVCVMSATFSAEQVFIWIKDPIFQPSPPVCSV